jgi:hypothetical protein
MEGLLLRPAQCHHPAGVINVPPAIAAGALMRPPSLKGETPAARTVTTASGGLRPLQGAARRLSCRITGPAPPHAASASGRVLATAALGRRRADVPGPAIGVLVAAVPAIAGVAKLRSVERQPAATDTSVRFNGILAEAMAPLVLAPHNVRRGLIGEARAEDADQGTGPQAAQDASPPGRHHESSGNSVEAVSIHSVPPPTWSWPMSGAITCKRSSASRRV